MKQKTHVVTTKIARRGHVANIEAAELLKCVQSAHRRLAHELEINKRSGAGVHGGHKKIRNRRERRTARQHCVQAGDLIP